MALVATSAVPIRADQRDAMLAQLGKDDLRLASVGFILSTANANRCARHMPATGLVLHSVDQYRGKWRTAAVRIFGTIGKVSVEGIVPQSPAAAAGLHPGDSIAAINGMETAVAGKAGAGATAARDRAEDLLVDLPPRGEIIFEIDRAGTASKVSVSPLVACRLRYEVVSGNAKFAQSNGTMIQIGQWLVDQVTDTELAVIVAHEMAHAILDHRSKLQVLEKSATGKRSKQYRELARGFEDEADRLAIHLLATAGYDPRAAPAFMRGLGVRLEGTESNTGLHNSPELRARLMEDEIDRLETDKNTRGGLRRPRGAEPR